ncbi:protein translocase subunit SecF [Candidatus Chromulinivorax destructor]|uniref:Protein-export membrane protein SecF n=1 Tax=Candidatus Chromulinivorax destructor TaxID=2066483 RepID=A0A345ZBW1_9BACT|nr:protein translocase subunit SecF [Candidatus Chromulinivorax destructor]AXK60778.1 protein translocase subunit SecF [Candidatus Chromulinivorax destructor]
MFHFSQYRIQSALLSLLVIFAGISAYIYNGGFRYSVDFTGGTDIRMRFDKPENTAAIKKAIHDEWNGTVYNIIDANEIIIRIQDTPETTDNLDQKIQATVDAVSIDNPGKILQKSSLSSAVGDSLRNSSIKAILIALALMLVYIAMRFRFAFAIGAVVALFHDALAVLACFLIINRPIDIDVVAAILAVLGYSINDTIVIFTQIRKNLVSMKGKALDVIVDTSINQTLRRTILTSASTSLVVGSMLIFGGDAIRSLSLAILLGIIFGTYSSIFIASSIMMLFYKENK